jgi:hypothetical protein
MVSRPGSAVSVSVDNLVAVLIAAAAGVVVSVVVAVGPIAAIVVPIAASVVTIAVAAFPALVGAVVVSIAVSVGVGPFRCCSPSGVTVQHPLQLELADFVSDRASKDLLGQPRPRGSREWRPRV